MQLQDFKKTETKTILKKLKTLDNSFNGFEYGLLPTPSRGKGGAELIGRFNQFNDFNDYRQQFKDGTLNLTRFPTDIGFYIRTRVSTHLQHHGEYQYLVFDIDDQTQLDGTKTYPPKDLLNIVYKSFGQRIKALNKSHSYKTKNTFHIILIIPNGLLNKQYEIINKENVKWKVELAEDKFFKIGEVCYINPEFPVIETIDELNSILQPLGHQLEIKHTRNKVYYNKNGKPIFDDSGYPTFPTHTIPPWELLIPLHKRENNDGGTDVPRILFNPPTEETPPTKTITITTNRELGLYGDSKWIKPTFLPDENNKGDDIIAAFTWSKNSTGKKTVRFITKPQKQLPKNEELTIHPERKQKYPQYIGENTNNIYMKPLKPKELEEVIQMHKEMPNIHIREVDYNLDKDIICYDKEGNYSLSKIKTIIVNLLKKENIVNYQDNIYQIRTPEQNNKSRYLKRIHVPWLCDAILNSTIYIDGLANIKYNDVETWILRATTKISKKYNVIGCNNGFLEYDKLSDAWEFKPTEEVKFNSIIPRIHYPYTYKPEYTTGVLDEDIIALYKEGLEFIRLPYNSTRDPKRKTMNIRNLLYGFGFLLIGNNSMDTCLIVLQGTRGSGKTTLARVLIKGFLADETGEVVKDKTMTRFNQIHGKEIAYYSDLSPQYSEQDIPIWKAVTGGEEFLYKIAHQQHSPKTESEQTFKLLITSNHNHDPENELTDRTIFIQFNKAFRGQEEEIKNYEELILKDHDTRERIWNLCINHYMHTKTSEHTLKQGVLEEFDHIEFIREIAKTTTGGSDMFGEMVEGIWKTYKKTEHYKSLTPEIMNDDMFDFQIYFQQYLVGLNYDYVLLGYMNSKLSKYCTDNRIPQVHQIRVTELRSRKYFNDESINSYTMDKMIHGKRVRITFMKGLELTSIEKQHIENS